MSEETKDLKEAEVTKEKASTDVMQDVLTVHSDTDKVVSAKTLLNAGCHFGHRVARWNPKMKPYIYGKKTNIHIIDLNKSAEMMQKAYVALRDLARRGKKVIFVGTKANAQKAVFDAATRCGSFYVNHRWLGGTLTNFKTISKRITLLKKIETEINNNGFDSLTKKELTEKLKLRDKLNENLEGIKEIKQYIPDAIVIVDPTVEHNAVAEARKVKIPVFALGDTNTNPDLIDYLVPANDDSEASINLILQLFADAICEGKNGNAVIAYKDVDDATTSMNELMESFDSVEQSKIIKAKLRNDTIAMRKVAKPGNHGVRKAVVRRDFKRNDNQNKDNVEANEEKKETAEVKTEEASKVEE